MRKNENRIIGNGSGFEHGPAGHVLKDSHIKGAPQTKLSYFLGSSGDVQLKFKYPHT